MINNPAFNKPSIPTGAAQTNKPGLGKPSLGKPGQAPAIKPGLGKPGKPFGQDGWNPAGTGEGLGKPAPKVPNGKLNMPPFDPAMIQNGSKAAHGAGCACCK